MICRIADRCPVGDLFFRINDLVCSVAKQELCLYIPLCTRYDHFSAKFFQKRSCLQGILEIASDRHKTNIIIFDSKRLQKILIGTVTDLCVCDIRKNFIDKIFILIHSHYFMSKLIQLVCNMLSKSSESDKQNIFHYNFLLYPTVILSSGLFAPLWIFTEIAAYISVSPPTLPRYIKTTNIRCDTSPSSVVIPNVSPAVPTADAVSKRQSDNATCSI